MLSRTGPLFGLLLGATVVAAAGIDTSYNLFVYQDLHATASSIGGRVAVGGNAFFANYSVDAALPNSSGQRDDLIVGGDLQFRVGQVPRGNVRYGGSAQFTNFGLPNGTAQRGTPLDFVTLQNDYTQYSAQLRQLAATGATTYHSWGGIGLTGSDTGLNVFHLDGSKLSQTSSLTISAPTNATVVVNVTGDAVSFRNAGHTLAGGIDATRVLFNFHDATSLTLQSVGLAGSLLAPGAHLHFNNGNVSGFGVVQSYQGTGAWNQVVSNAELPNLRVIPEPGTGLLLALGLGLLIAQRRLG